MTILLDNPTFHVAGSKGVTSPTKLYRNNRNRTVPIEISRLEHQISFYVFLLDEYD